MADTLGLLVNEVYLATHCITRAMLMHYIDGKDHAPLAMYRA